MTDFTKFNASTHPIVKLEDDWNNLLDHGLEKTANYIIRKNGSYYEAIKGGTSTGAGTIAFGGSGDAGGKLGTDASAVLQGVLTALVPSAPEGCRGRIHYGSGSFGFPTSIIPPAGNGHLFISGNGLRNTILAWTGATADYLLDFDATGVVTLKDLEVNGASVGKGIRFKRDLAGEGMVAFCENVKVSYCVDPAIKCDYLQDSVFVNPQFLNNTGFDLDAVSSSHIQVHGGLIEKAKVDASLFKMFGGALRHINWVKEENYGGLLDGVAFDPVPTGYASHIIIGSSLSTELVKVTNCCFLGEPEEGGYFIDIIKGQGTEVSNNNYLTTFGGTYINVQATSQNTVLRLPQEFDVPTKLADAGERTTVTWRGRIYGLNTTEGNAILDSNLSYNAIELANDDKNLLIRLIANDVAAFLNIKSLSATGAAELTRLTISNKVDVARIEVGDATLRIGSSTHGTPVEGDTRINAHKLEVYLNGAWQIVTSV